MLAVLALAACAGGGEPGARSPEQLVVKVRASYPHDPGAFTQGLVYHAGRLYESTGLTGRSSVRRVDLRTGRVEAQAALAPTLFGEGLARVGDELWQLTWKDGRAFVWDLEDLRPLRQHRYPGEGWGLCADGQRLVMSDGSSRLLFRDPTDFERTGAVSVEQGGEPVGNLNELECVGQVVYANIWQEERIARIDPDTGRVTGSIDASGLLAPEERAGVDVLNGIAYVPERGTFLLTGKLWPRLFEVEFVPRGG